MNLIRHAIDSAIADAIAEHPKYFTPKGHEHARVVILRKIMMALRGEGQDKSAAESSAPFESARPILAEPHSRAAIAFVTLRKAAGAVEPFRTGDGMISIPAEAQGEDVQALADAPTVWLFITDRQQIGAWQEFFRDALPGVPRKPIAVVRDGQTGIVVPWPWPPAKTGKTYQTDEDAA